MNQGNAKSSIDDDLVKQSFSLVSYVEQDLKDPDRNNFTFTGAKNRISGYYFIKNGILDIGFDEKWQKFAVILSGDPKKMHFVFYSQESCDEFIKEKLKNAVNRYEISTDETELNNETEDDGRKEFEAKYDPELDDKTETEARLNSETKVRRGQDEYRRRLDEYWGGACAVTGVTLREVLRASHAKPWCDCKSGHERLSQYNGLLLTANLDALFDKNLIAFDDTGQIMISPLISNKDQERLGISTEMKLRKISPEHLPYLRYQREKLKH